MKIAEIVEQIRKVLPLSSTRYSSSVSITSITGDGATATVVTSAPHGLDVGNPVDIVNVAIETLITSVTVTGSKATIETATNHDLTLGWPPHDNVTLSGFTDPDWNDSFELLEVPNRRKFVINSGALTTPALNTNEILQELVIGGFNGTQQVATVPDTTSFTFASTFNGASIGGDVITNLFIFGAVSRGRAWDEYTAQDAGKVVIFVVQQDSANVSKDRRALGDAVSEQGATTSFELDILDGFDVFAFINTKGDKNGLDSSDICRDEVLRDVLLAIQRYQPSSGLANSTPSRVVLSSHGPAAYDGPTYTHQYSFQIPLRMSGDDTVVNDRTVAFRDVGLSIQSPDILEALTATVDLDEEVIPT